MTDLFERLKANTYPGRGIVLGRSGDGSCDVIAYFIMGRSVNSRNRVFIADGSGIRTEAFDPSKMVDPSLIIYHPVRAVKGCTITTNGDQTDTVFAALRLGGSFESALRTRCFEPDAPNFTPRISGITEPDGSYKLSILKAADSEGVACTREFFEYEPKSGVGHLIHTYDGDGNPIPTFSGEPVCVGINGDIDEFADNLWQALNPDNKVSLFVRYISRNDGLYRDKIINKNV